MTVCAWIRSDENLPSDDGHLMAGSRWDIVGQTRERTINLDHRCSVMFNWEHRSCDAFTNLEEFLNATNPRD